MSRREPTGLSGNGGGTPTSQTANASSPTNVNLETSVQLPRESSAVHSFEDDVDDAVEDLFLVGNVVVQRHGLDAQLVSERAYRERADAGSVR